MEVATNEVSAALVGSSNLSQNTLSESTGNYVTHECDVYIWESKKFKSTFSNVHTYWVSKKTNDQRNVISEVLDLSVVIPANTAIPQKMIFDHLLNKFSSYRI